MSLYTIIDRQKTNKTMKLKEIFKIEKKPKKGLFAYEWAMAIYLLFTLVLLIFMWGRAANPMAMLQDRALVVLITAAAWLLYRLLPCRLTRLLRVVAQLSLLSVWYSDTYEYNRMFPNLDHIFAAWEQTVFGFQPSLLFAKNFANGVVSELMCLGYASYFLLIAIVAFYFFFCRYDKFHRAAFIILGSFFIYYVVFIFLPVTGPQYYYPAAGLENIASGIFPDLGNYFATMRDPLPTPGYEDGVFYQMVVEAHNAGERPTAAFPSSHVGVTTILMLLAWRAPSRRLFLFLLPFYVLMCFATVYIYAHYAIDVFAGWASAVLIYTVLNVIYVKFIRE